MAVCEEEINLTALQRIDAKIIHVVDNASQVALYEFDIDKDIWVDTEIQGSLFICKRSEIPYHGFVIMNRMNTTNLVEQFIRGLEFKKQEPYLMYKNKFGKIYCTWFYELKDYLRVTTCIQRIVHAMKGKAKAQRKRSSSEGASTPNNPNKVQVKVPDVISMLTQAQEEYDEQNVKKIEPSKSLSVSAVNEFKEKPHINMYSPVNGKVNSINLQKHLISSSPIISSRHRSLSGDETALVVNEEINIGHPIFVPNHSENSHDSSLLNAFYKNGITKLEKQRSVINHIPHVMKEMDLGISPLGHHSLAYATQKLPNLCTQLQNGSLDTNSSNNHTISNFPLPPLDIDNHCIKKSNCIVNNPVICNPNQKTDITENYPMKTFDECDNFKSNLICQDKPLEEVKQYLIQLLSRETSFVDRIHNAHLAAQLYKSNSPYHL